MKLNYQKICQDLLKDLPQRTRDVVEKRFGLKTGERKTLEAIGKNYGICRERVRQIEADGFLRLKPKLEKYQGVFQYFSNQIHDFGDLKKEEILLNLLGSPRFQNQTFFLLTLGERFKRFSENRDFYSLWTISPDSLTFAKSVLDLLYNKLAEINQPQNFEEIFKKIDPNLGKPLTPRVLQSFLEVSKKIQSGIDGQFGLKDWPEINPRGVKDRVYLIFKKEKKPLHFTEVTRLINSSKYKKISQPPALVQTVHNELIKDPRFVLVGRGLYALREWGYVPGVVKDIISMILKEEKRPLTKEEIIERVLKQRVIKVNTILINLNHFPRTPNGKYKYGGRGEQPILG
ncbi:hypothetical protein KJA14_00850 [Patescibacteria group bacterium]|nr:hypothetical protein [Patescibacteria group bacterium]